MKIKRQLLMFSASGVIGLLVDLSTLYVASMLLNLYAARIVSFLTAVFSTWLLNRTFTFRVSETSALPNTNLIKHLMFEFFHYLTANISGGLVNLAVYSTFISFNLEPSDKYIATCMGSLSGLLLNFTLSKFFVFQK
jgi:putative flippase GtrA